ncbi:MAG: 5-carboxymethyl-2-hydroxymuconate isomerase [Proteobacteria bacterium]|nr:MAG: 5-carboxymethyl-2-hydroxymuconate isomerase [Pseudomonadota bacterium]
MRIIRYRDGAGAVRYGVAGADGAYWRAEGDPFEELRETAEAADLQQWLAPVEPTMIWCIGQNYRAHSQEVGMTIPDWPVVFAKGPHTAIGHGQAIEVPRYGRTDEVDYEAELVVVIGKRCKNVTREQALDYVLGYTCGNDVSARDWQLKTGGGQWCRGKTFDTFAPMGPCLVTTDEIGDAAGLRVETQVNGKTMQHGNTRDMIFDVRFLIEFLSKSTTLSPGTVIFSGTPPGVGMAQKPPVWLKEGDTVSVTVEKIGMLTNPVKNECA